MPATRRPFDVPEVIFFETQRSQRCFSVAFLTFVRSPSLRLDHPRRGLDLVVRWFAGELLRFCRDPDDLFDSDLPRGIDGLSPGVGRFPPADFDSFSVAGRNRPYVRFGNGRGGPRELLRLSY